MHRDALRENLRKLHSELASVEELDEDLHTLLRQVADDIEKMLGDEAVEAHSVRARLEDAAVKFEADHPRLAGILGELADRVTKLGI
jgi:hypothetical protein